MSKSASTVRNFVAENPKWIGVLFWLTVLLMETTAAASGASPSTPGP